MPLAWRQSARSVERGLGQKKIIKRLDEKMAKRGVSEKQRESLWLCEECKHGALLGEFKREIEASLGL